MLNFVNQRIKIFLFSLLVLFLSGCSSKEAKFKQAEAEFNTIVEQCVANCRKIEPPGGLASLEKIRKKDGIYAYRKAYAELYFKKNEALVPVEEKLDKLQDIAQGDAELTSKLVRMNAKWQEIRFYQLFVYANNANLLVNGKIPTVVNRSITVN